jgi:hypothetical protein
MQPNSYYCISSVFNLDAEKWIKQEKPVFRRKYSLMPTLRAKSPAEQITLGLHDPG